MNVPRFVGISLVAALVLAGLGEGINRAFELGAGGMAMAVAASAAFIVGTAGWTVAGRGLAQDPRKFPAYFMAGLVTKFVLLGAAIVIVRLGTTLPLAEFLVPFALMFAGLGIVQMIVVARQALARIDRAPRHTSA